MCEHCNGDCLEVEEILSLPELVADGKYLKKGLEEDKLPDDIKLREYPDDITLEELNKMKEEVAEEIELLDYDDIKKEIRGYELIFLSHPFADDPIANKQRVDFIAKEIRETNPEALILSPLHSFSYFDDDSMREAIMNECYHMIDRADVCVFVQYDGFMSSGQSDEILYAEECGKEIEVEEINQQMLDRKLGIVE